MSDWNIINVNLLKENDQRELSKLFNLINPWLLFLCKKDEEMANDIFLILISKLDKFDENRGKFHNFVYTLCSNSCKNAFLKQKRDRKRQEKENFDFLYSENNTEDDDNDFLEAEFIKMHTAIDKLSENHKKFIENYLFGTKHNDNKERVMFFQIKTNLKKIIGDELNK